MVALAYPLPRRYPVTTPYGVPAALGGRIHTGIDLGAPSGTAVLAPAAGVVSKARWVYNGGGREVDLDHGDGLQTRFMHLKSYTVREGQQVAAGQRIGEVGASGLVTGAHLHYEVWIGGQHVDPAPYVGGAAAPTAASNLGHILDYAGGCRSGYLPAKIEGIIGSMELGKGLQTPWDLEGPRIVRIGKPGEAGDWNACLLASRGYTVGQNPWGVETVAGGLAHEVGEGFADALAAAVPLLANGALVLLALFVGWTGVKQVIGAR